MKNCYIPKELLKEVQNFETPEPTFEFVSCDPSSAEAYEKLNPVLTDGHRMNPITAIVDKSAPNEVLMQLQQFIGRIPQDKRIQDLTDDELIELLPPRSMQQLPELDVVRQELVRISELIGVGVEEPAPQEPPKEPEPAPTPPSGTEPSKE